MPSIRAENSDNLALAHVLRSTDLHVRFPIDSEQAAVYHPGHIAGPLCREKSVVNIMKPPYHQIAASTLRYRLLIASKTLMMEKALYPNIVLI